MKKLKDLLNAGQILDRSEMKKIMAGCGGCDLNPSQSLTLYNGFANVTVNCCSSCGTGNFLNAGSS